MQKNSSLLLGLIAAFGFVLSGCSHHLAQVDIPDYGPPGEPASQTSFFGRAGASTNSATGLVRCDKEGFGRVEVERNIGQGLIAALTLGTINPATIKFNCMPPAQVPEYVCEAVVGTQEIVCTKNPDGEGSEVVTFDCEPVTAGSPVTDGFTCTPQSSAWTRILPWIEASESARG